MVAQRTNQLKNRTKPTTQKTRNLAQRRTVSPYFFVFIFIPLSREQAPTCKTYYRCQLYKQVLTREITVVKLTKIKSGLKYGVYMYMQGLHHTVLALVKDVQEMAYNSVRVPKCRQQVTRSNTCKTYILTSTAGACSGDYGRYLVKAQCFVSASNVILISVLVGGVVLAGGAFIGFRMYKKT